MVPRILVALIMLLKMQQMIREQSDGFIIN